MLAPSFERCQARCRSHAFQKGADGPYMLFLAPGEEQHPRFSTLNPEERTNRLEAFPGRYLLLTPHFLKSVLRSSSYLRSVVNSRGPWFNAVTFLHMALRHATRTLCCFQGTTCLFFFNRQKAVIRGAEAKRRLTTWVETQWLAAG
jgi:hypothetical protein